MTDENKKKKKRRPAGITFNIAVDADTGEIEEEFLWDEDHDPPPLVKPENKKKKH
jgi:hypothetical protein